MSWFNKKLTKRNENDGQKFENKVAKKLGKQVVITDRNKNYYKGNRRFVEIDIETKTCAIEVKSGKLGKKLASQLNKYKEVTEKEPLAFAPNIPKREKERISGLGYGIYSEFKPMAKHIKNKEKGDKKWKN